MASEYVVLLIGAVAAAAFVFRDSIFGGSPKAPPVPVSAKSTMVGGGDPRDFVARMKAGVRLSPTY
jgi:NADPH-ferrihemoprotein reductase